MQPNQAPSRRIGHLDVQTGIGLFLILALVHSVSSIQPLAAATGLIMCMQETGKFTLKASLTRLLGVVIGGTCGILVVLADNVVQNPWLFFLLSGIGVIMTLLGCKLAKMPYITAKVSCITFVLVILVATGDGRIIYALNRLLGTAVGAVVAVAVSYSWNLAVGKMRAGRINLPQVVDAPEKEKETQESNEMARELETAMELEEAVNSDTSHVQHSSLMET